MPKPENTRLSVFKGRKAKLNRTIFQTLALKGPQTIYDVHKQVRAQRGLRCTRYASVNKRVRSLEESSFIVKVGSKEDESRLRSRDIRTDLPSLSCYYALFNGSRRPIKGRR